MHSENLGSYNHRWAWSFFVELMKVFPYFHCTRDKTHVQSLMLTAHTKYEKQLKLHFCLSQEILKMDNGQKAVSSSCSYSHYIT